MAKVECHPAAAAVFGVPQPDSGLPSLRYENQRLLEKQMVSLHATTGAMAAVVMRVLGLLEGIAFSTNLDMVCCLIIFLS